MAFRPEDFRKDIPILQKKDAPVYFDNACMSLRPRQVIDEMNRYYEEFPACAGRSVHALSRKVDEEIHKSRKEIQGFIGAKYDKEIIFTRNTTEGLNLVARSFPFKRGDVILLSDKEHNSNLLPWQLVARRTGAVIDIIGSNPDNTFSIDNLKEKLAKHQGRVKMLALGMTSNLDGASVPAKDLIKLAHANGAKVTLDAAQSAPHQELDVRHLGVDYLAFSGHKMLGPSGIGVLYGTEKTLMELDLYNVGGETVQDATYHDATYETLPNRFEAGLQYYPGIMGLAQACRCLNKAGRGAIHKHEVALTAQIKDGIHDIKGLEIIGPQDPAKRGGITSFTIKGMSPHDIATLMDASKRIAIRSGAHCVHSWFNKHNHQGSARASVYLYNTPAEAETFIAELKGISKLAKR